MKWYRLAAEKGDADAQYQLGEMFFLGRGVRQDDEEAVRWYRMAAEQEHDSAQHAIGTMYQWGRGVPQSYPEAAEWFRRAAMQGHWKAHCLLGDMYALGQGVPRSYVTAFAHLTISAAQAGPECVAEKRDWLAERMTSAEIARAERMAAECAEQHYRGCEF